MKIIIVGASGTMGKHLTNAFAKEHEVVTAATDGCEVKVDITSRNQLTTCTNRSEHLMLLFQQQVLLCRPLGETYRQGIPERC